MSESFSQGRIKKFEFEGKSYMPILLILSGVILAAIAVYIGIVGIGISVGFVLSMLAFFMLIIFALYFRIGHIYSDLVISDHEIRREIFGIKWKSMSWSDVKQITVVKTLLPGTYQLIWYVVVHSYERTLGWSPLKPTIMFTEKTKDKEELVATINSYAEKYGIKFFQRKKVPGGGAKWRELDMLRLSDN